MKHFSYRDDAETYAQERANETKQDWYVYLDNLRWLATPRMPDMFEVKPVSIHLPY